MGFESFRVELCGGPGTHAAAVKQVWRLPHAETDPLALGTPGAAYFRVADGTHVIEVEVAPDPVRVSCRFTLCHPPSVDEAFLGLVRGLADRTAMTARIADADGADAGPFPAKWFDEFAAVARRLIAARRAEWVRAFGPDILAAGTPEVFERVILPRSTPVPAG